MGVKPYQAAGSLIFRWMFDFQGRLIKQLEKETARKAEREDPKL
jgi:hypothetical protein